MSGRMEKSVEKHVVGFVLSSFEDLPSEVLKDRLLGDYNLSHPSKPIDQPGTEYSGPIPPSSCFPSLRLTGMYKIADYTLFCDAVSE